MSFILIYNKVYGYFLVYILTNHISKINRTLAVKLSRTRSQNKISTKNQNFPEVTANRVSVETV